MKKLIIVIVSVVMTAWGVSAQDIFFPSRQGLTLLYANLDAKDKVDSYTRQTIQQVEGSGNNMSITYVGQLLDKNRKPASDLEVPFTVTVNNGVVEWDMKMYAAPGTEGFIEIEGDKLRIPSSLSPGDKLDDAKFTMTLNMGFKIRTEISLTEQECLAIEDVTVPAGTFKCHKVTQTGTATVMRKTTTTKTVSWYAPGIGTVKTESYNDKGKLQSSTVLQAVEN
jgi:opacity protein-like surface antigen